MWRQKFQCDRPVQFLVERFVYDAHTAGTKTLNDVVMGEMPSD